MVLFQKSVTLITESAILIYNGSIAALCADKTVFFNTVGEEVGSADSGVDAQSIALHSSNSVYVLGMTEIRDVSIT